MTPAAGGDRIVIDPVDLRRTATRMRGAAVVLSGTGRDLAARPMPSMPANVAALVTEVVYRANFSLQDLADELVTEARTLEARAMWAELGGGDALGWLIPGLHRVGPAPPKTLGPGSVLPPVTDEQVMQGERWALEELDAMLDATQLFEGEGAWRGTGVDDVPGADLLRFANEISVPPVGRSTLAAELPPNAYEHHEGDGAEAAFSVPHGSAGAAVGAAVGSAVTGSAGAGMVGCLIAGGIGGAWDQAEDELFE